MSLTEAIANLKSEMRAAGIEQEHGLGTELFHFSSTLAPVVNVDLLITDDQDRVLLSWRDDGQTGKGWHIPGSCIRFREILEDAIQRCASSELGCKVKHSIEPIKVYEFHWKTYRSDVADQRERTHFITLTYACKLSADYDLNAHNLPEGQPGYLRWFDTMPEDILPIQECYKRDWEDLKLKIKNAEEMSNELE